MGTDLRLANKIWRVAETYSQELGHAPEMMKYGTAITLVAALLEDKELAQELYDQADVKQRSDEDLREEAITSSFAPSANPRRS